tara:strand:+ start:78 stop:392 length:315 start_codon:yes stop_codon:yes gene_type:complete
MSARSDSWIQWGLGIFITLTFAMGVYGVAAVSGLEDRIDILEQSDAASHQLLNDISKQLDRIENKLTQYDDNIREFYIRKPVFEEDLNQFANRIEGRLQALEGD